MVVPTVGHGGPKRRCGGNHHRKTTAHQPSTTLNAPSEPIASISRWWCTDLEASEVTTGFPVVFVRPSICQ
ncbi:hypothetical protein HanRHA438_Chr03g0101811 [Helianthus annuus]|nr:hypothetical protein HanRHA438_Chr03g0101811 [Helianthus annuus]